MSKVIIVHLRQPKKGDPKERRDDPFWEFGSFGCTRCHFKNLMNPRKIAEVEGVRLAFAQGGPSGFKLVHLTPPVSVVRHSDRCELRWAPPQMPFRYEFAPLLIDNSGESDLSHLHAEIAGVDRTSWKGRFSSSFRSRREPLGEALASELIDVFVRRAQTAKPVNFATRYDQALPYSPPCVDMDRRATYERLLAAAGGTASDAERANGAQRKCGSKS